MAASSAPIDLSKPGERLLARAHLTLVDHGFLRVFWTHLYEIAPGAWRSNQPGPGRIKAYAEAGFKSVLHLRGAHRSRLYVLEEDSCLQHGLKFQNIQINATSLKPRTRVLTLLDAFAAIEKPFVMHCKSGIDRTGLAAFLYLLAETDTPPEIARQQLSLKFLHLKTSRHGILDHMADAYLAAYEDSGIGLRAWIESVYDHEALTAEYRAKRGRT